MALTKIGSIGINTGIAFAGVTTITTLNGSDAVLSVGGTVNFNSDVSIGGSVSIGGTLTYEDVTNIDSVGLITARAGVLVGSGITLSKDGDGFFTGIVTATSYYGDGSNLSNITSTTINSNADNRLITGSGTANTLNGESNLTFDGSTLTLNGDATFTGASANIVFDKSDDALEFNDDAKATFGTGADTTLTHSGADFAITNTTGNLNILNNSDEAVQIRHGSETMIKAISDGAVELYHDGTKQCETSANGLAFPSGKGIDFNATSDSAGATSEILDDYEEGIWTPTVSSGGHSITTTHYAKYVKIGRFVNVTAYFDLASGSGDGNSFKINGLPYNSAGNGYSPNVIDIGQGGIKGAYTRISDNSSHLDVLYSSESTSTGRLTLTGNQVAGGNYIIISASYHVA